MAAIDPIYNGESGASVRAKLNELIDTVNSGSTTINVGDAPLYDPQKAGGYAAGSIVSYKNESSPDVEFQEFAIYLALYDIPQGVGPEDSPDWKNEGATVEVAGGNTANGVVQNITRLRELTGMRTGHSVTVQSEGSIYIFNEGSEIGVKPFAPGIGSWIRSGLVSLSNLARVFTQHDAAEGDEVFCPLSHAIINFAPAGNVTIADDNGNAALNIVFDGPCVVRRIAAPFVLSSFEVTPLIDLGDGHVFEDSTGNILPARNVAKAGAGIEFEDDAVGEKTVVRVEEDLIDHIDGADEEKHTSDQIIEAAAHALISTVENAKVSEVLQAIVTYLSTVLTVEGIDLSAIEVGESVLPRVTKQVDGSGLVDTASELIDKHVATTIDSLINENANWGNISGKSSDWVRIFGDNQDGQLGDVAQEYVNNEGVFFECRGSLLELQANGGYADWVRNRNRDVLKSDITLENNIINAVLAASFNSDGRAAITSPRCKLGDWFVVHPEGYRYSCYREEDTTSDGQADLWWWYRDSLPDSDSLQVFSTGNYVNLVTALNAHDFTTGSYDPSVLGATDEKGVQGQEYYNASTRELFRCIWDGAKVIWEQINIVK